MVIGYLSNNVYMASCYFEFTSLESSDVFRREVIVPRPEKMMWLNYAASRETQGASDGTAI